MCGNWQATCYSNYFVRNWDLRQKVSICQGRMYVLKQGKSWWRMWPLLERTGKNRQLTVTFLLGHVLFWKIIAQLCELFAEGRKRTSSSEGGLGRWKMIWGALFALYGWWSARSSVIQWWRSSPRQRLSSHVYSHNNGGAGYWELERRSKFARGWYNRKAAPGGFRVCGAIFA